MHEKLNYAVECRAATVLSSLSFTLAAAQMMAAAALIICRSCGWAPGGASCPGMCAGAHNMYDARAASAASDTGATRP
jgi:hypothetical protein